MIKDIDFGEITVISDLLKQMTKPIVFTESQTKESSILK